MCCCCVFLKCVFVCVCVVDCVCVWFDCMFCLRFLLLDLSVCFCFEVGVMFVVVFRVVCFLFDVVSLGGCCLCLCLLCCLVFCHLCCSFLVCRVCLLHLRLFLYVRVFVLVFTCC